MIVPAFLWKTVKTSQAIGSYAQQKKKSTTKHKVKDSTQNNGTPWRGYLGTFLLGIRGMIFDKS